MSKKEQIDHLFKRIDNFVKTPTKDLISNVKSTPAGNITFNELELEINQLKEILNLVTKESLTALPSYKIGEFEVLLSPLFSGINQIQNFKKDPRVSDEQQKRDIVQSFFARI